MAITNGYATLPQLKAALGLASSDEADDDALERAVTAASRLIDGYCGRRFYQPVDGVGDPTDTTLYFTASKPTRVRIDDATSVTTLEVDRAATDTWSEVDAGDYVLEPRNAPQTSKPYTHIRLTAGSLPTCRDGIRVTGQFGWPSVPAELVEATILQASRLFKRAREAPFGIAQMPSLDGGGMRLSSKLDPDVELLVRPYRRPVVA